MNTYAAHPVLSLAVLASWLALNGLSVAHALLGLVLGLVIPRAVAPFMSAAPGRLRLLPGLKLLAVVVWDIGVANVRVARLVLGRMETLRPAFVTVPLDARSDHAIALLSRIITITPGTTTVGIDRRHSRLLVHALHTDDAAALVAGIKARYERPLIEALEC